MKTVMLLGAGASADAGVPTMTGFIPKFREHLGPGVKLDALDLLVGRLAERFGDEVDLELLLAALDHVRHLDRDLTSAIVSVGPHEFDTATLEQVDVALRDFLRVACSRPIRPTTVEYLKPILEFARSNGGTLDIFSLNYDLAVEVVCDSHGVRYIDGCAPLWNPTGFNDEGHGEDLLVRLAKLHGSLTWHERPRYSFVEIPVLPEAGHTPQYFDHAPLEPLLLYPAFGKEVNRSIYNELSHRFSAALRPGACDLLVVIGYSFRDEATRTLVFAGATEARRCPPFDELQAAKLAKAVSSSDARRLLFASAIVLTEGETEFGAFPEWWRKSHPSRPPDSFNLVVFPVTGDTYFETYVRFADAYAIPWAIVCDGKALSQGGEASLPN